jgi:nicotinamidase-related amidase
MDSLRSALVVVDMQHYFVESQSPLLTLVEHVNPGAVTPYVQRVAVTVVPAIQKLLHAFRSGEQPVFYTQFGSRTADGSDLPLWARRINELGLATIGKLVYPEFDDESAAIIPALSPEKGEVVLRKTTAGTLSSTDLDAQLSELGLDKAIVCGVNTDVCVGQTARELSDRGYDVVMVEDGCATLAPDAHQTTLETFGVVFGRSMSADDIVGELTRVS